MKHDDTLGGRLVLASSIAPFAVRLTGSAQTSRHAQVDSNVQAGAVGPRLVYRQNLLTICAEADAPVGPARATVGIAE